MEDSQLVHEECNDPDKSCNNTEKYSRKSTELRHFLLSRGRLKLELMGHPADITAFSVWFPVQARSIWRSIEEVLMTFANLTAEWPGYMSHQKRMLKKQGVLLILAVFCTLLF